jgi:hypothetical protein
MLRLKSRSGGRRAQRCAEMAVIVAGETKILAEFATASLYEDIPSPTIAITKAVIYPKNRKLRPADEVT